MKKVDYYRVFVARRFAKSIVVTLSLTIAILVFYSSLCFGVDFEVIVDEHETLLPTEGGYYNLTGGDRGVLNVGDISFSRDGDSSYKVESIGGILGGMWYGLIRVNNDKIPLDFGAIFGPYIKPEYQGQIVGAEIVVSNAHSPSNNPALELRIEFKDENGMRVHFESWTDLSSGNYPRIYTVSLNPPQIGNVKEIVWVMDQAQVGDSVSVDRVRLKASVPEMPTEEQAFLWTYSWLMTNYDPTTGMVQDRSNFGSGDMENVTATAKAAKLTYYAYQKGYVTYDNAVEIITNIANTLINVVPRGPSGVNTLWPHFTQNGGTEALVNTEWASGDTAYAALDMIAALQLLGDPQDQLDDLVEFLQEIDWEALLLGNGSISHGYDYEGDLIPYGWKSFGMETIGVAWAYASATGNVAVMDPPPSDNGSGFIDNAHYPVVLSGRDLWCNDWDAYRSNMADTQIGWYCSQAHANEFLCDAGLFGLSAAENPEGDNYVAYGVGGSIIPPEDGNGEVIVLHYSGMIADIRPEASRQVWEVLRDRNSELLPEPLHDRVIISPLNNMESMSVDRNTGEPTINHLKGSWNLALQAEGWAYADPDIRNKLIAAIEENAFLNSGYSMLVRPVGPEINVKQGTTDIPNGGNYDFGTVNLGSSTLVTFTIENIGTEDLTLDGSPMVQISGIHAGDFSVTQQPISPVVGPCASVSFTIEFAPSATDTLTADVSIANNDDDENLYILTLSGFGISTGPGPEPPPAIPEPTTLVLFGLGLIGLLVARKKLKKKK